MSPTEKLVDRYGLGAEARAHRKRFLRLTDADEATLRAFRDQLAARSHEFIDRFYDHLLQFEDTRALLLADSGRLERLRETQRRYFIRLLEGDYDEAYFEERLRVGHAHHRVGLAPQWYLGAYSLYLQMNLPLLLELCAGDSERAMRAVQALVKIVFLDLGLAIDTYIETAHGALEASRGYLERVIVSISDGLLVLDRGGVIEDVNPALTTLSGYTREELIGRPPTVLGLVDGDMALRDLLASAAARAAGLYGDYEVRSKDGERIPVSASTGPIRDRVGKLLGYVIVLRDVRERNRLVAALEQAKATLEQRVEERTRELRRAQAKLFQSEKLSAIGQLAAGIAHEIGTPLNVISGRAEYLLAELGDDPRSQNLQVIVGQIDRITGLIEQLLDFARERGEEMGPVRVKRAAESILSLIEARLRKQGITLELDLDHLPEVYGNLNRLQQVFLNLLVNASDAIREVRPKGPGHIVVRGAVEGDEVHLLVHDDGCGIPPDQVARIFDPFFTTKPVGQGTGLGLSVTYGLMQDMGGAIRAESVPGQGTTFHLRFRRAGAARPR